MLAEYIGVAQLNDLISRQAELVEKVSLSELQRLLQLLVPLDSVDEPEVSVCLKFRCPEGAGVPPVLAVKIDGELGLECQRCLRPMVWSPGVDTELVLQMPGRSPDESYDQVDHIEVTEQGLELRELIEDELVSAIPFSPRHSEQCEVVSLTVEEEAEDESTHKPFTGLADLLKDGQSEN